MKQVIKLGAIAVLVTALWLSLLLRSDLPDRVAKFVPYLPILAIFALGCYGVVMVAYGLLVFPSCPKEAILLQQDIIEAKDFLEKKGIVF
ncbi:dolichol-phosphate mannose synthase subunit 3-like [Selaginella moellendorffii]|uniref:dolichol-phosphate mannose synthase subunit 3-like n=1 Tax=Selaginella moellendorffii TaxID=88036 RepID=UPI000D1D10DA|nr:dolichol-phosphate mannose synthase subunit 3-like [Selaginella moellendorffii]|eukprot:XP_024527251.1 dolichol-phosphate mannose synthase subunit 3-like [Selaginella moellendorffii]